MKRNKILLYTLLALGLLVSSCEDIIDKKPPLELDNGKVLSTYDGLVQATNAAYSTLYDNNWYGAEFILDADLKGGNTKSSPLNTGRYQTEYNWGNNASNTAGLWNPAYVTIAAANNVLNSIDELDEAGVTQDQKDQLKGECLFLRGLGHFDLVRMYAQPYTYQGGETPGVPIVLETKIDLPARNTVKEVYTQVVADLKAAEGLMNEDRGISSGAADPKAFANIYAVQALLARVYLYMGDWNNAAAYATKVIGSGKFQMYTADEYPLVWGTNAASEVIFEVYGNLTESDWPGLEEVGYLYNPEGYGDICVSQELVDMFEPGDVRGQFFVSSDKAAGYLWPGKFPGKGNDAVNNIPVLRLSEMYLIRAEAVLNGASGNAKNDINMIRSNRGASELPAVFLTDVYKERRLELCFEGHQLWDLSRTGRSLERVNEDGKISGPVNVDFPSYLWAMPIPVYELEANKNMVQNEGY